MRHIFNFIRAPFIAILNWIRDIRMIWNYVAREDEHTAFV